MKHFNEQVLKADKIAITGHIHPDGDCIGSCLALKQYTVSYTHLITDHGVLQGFPIARHAYEDLKLKEDDPFKIIYGVEGYFVDDLGDLIID